MEFYRQYWSGLGTGLLIIGALTPEDMDIELIDENIEDIDFDRHYDLVAITAMTQQAPRAYEIARSFRKKNVKVVMGGIHPTILPNEALNYADSVVVGEAENLWGKLLNDFINKGGNILACGTCMRSRNMKDSKACPISSVHPP